MLCSLLAALKQLPDYTQCSGHFLSSPHIYLHMHGLIIFLSFTTMSCTGGGLWWLRMVILSTICLCFSISGIRMDMHKSSCASEVSRPYLCITRLGVDLRLEAVLHPKHALSRETYVFSWYWAMKLKSTLCMITVLKCAAAIYSVRRCGPLLGQSQKAMNNLVDQVGARPWIEV